MRYDSFTKAKYVLHLAPVSADAMQSILQSQCAYCN